MKENKEETKLQSEQEMTLHELKGNINEVMNELRYGFTDYDEAADRLFRYASQFKSQLPIEQKPFNGCSPTACGCKSLADCPNNQSFITVQFKSQPLPIKGVEREWISVEERLPQESGRYWCYVVHFGELGRSSEQVNCSYSERHGFTEKLNPMNVTHWMPLPPPPKKNG